MAWNVPDDWGQFYEICDVCGVRYHTSGDEVCRCVYCEECGDVLRYGDTDGICLRCQEADTDE